MGFETCRSCDHEGFFPAARDLDFLDEKRQPPIMVSVEMGYEDGADHGGIEAEALHPDQRRFAAVDEEPAPGRIHENAALESSSAAEGIA